jgi:hypothetical protein
MTRGTAANRQTATAKNIAFFADYMSENAIFAG